MRKIELVAVVSVIATVDVPDDAPVDRAVERARELVAQAGPCSDSALCSPTESVDIEVSPWVPNGI